MHGCVSTAIYIHEHIYASLHTHTEWMEAGMHGCMSTIIYIHEHIYASLHTHRIGQSCLSVIMFSLVVMWRRGLDIRNTFQTALLNYIFDTAAVCSHLSGFMLGPLLTPTSRSLALAVVMYPLTYKAVLCVVREVGMGGRDGSVKV